MKGGGSTWDPFSLQNRWCDAGGHWHLGRGFTLKYALQNQGGWKLKMFISKFGSSLLRLSHVMALICSLTIRYSTKTKNLDWLTLAH